MKVATNTEERQTAEPPCLYLVLEESAKVKRVKVTSDSWK